MRAKHTHFRMLVAVAAAALTAFQGGSAQAATLNLADSPLFLNQAVPPLNMLVMGRDHKLFYEAYNDASDLDGDGVVDSGYKPDQIDYYGYFDSHFCYTYNGSGSGQFEPASITVDKTCSGQWSGDFLNYVTTVRIDALRKVLYGGFRRTDSSSQTVLERSYVPQDAHSWGKEYTSTTVDGYDISKYTPLSQPTAGMRHLIANTTLLNDSNNPQLPRMRVLQNQAQHIWEWVSIERPVADNNIAAVGASNGTISVTPTDYTVRVKVCVSDTLHEGNCKKYGSVWKPTGLLHDYGENGSMLFGLLSGSYTHNTQGGVLRKAVGTFTDEVNAADGTFNTATNGIVSTLNNLRIPDFGAGYQYSCGWITDRPINDGECSSWGNPIAEMMYETLRYFAGKSGPLAAFDYANAGSVDNSLGLPKAAWSNPYSGKPSCSKPFMTVVSDINPSYDSDTLPGTYFGAGVANDLPGPGLNVQAQADGIFAAEQPLDPSLGRNFIGQSAGLYDGAPTPKPISGFGSIRGLAPEEPTKQGSYYAASVANYGRINDISSTTSGKQEVNTFAITLASPLPRIEIPVGNGGKKITLVPFAKSVGGCLGVTPTPGGFQPTNQIVDFYVETLTPTYGRFRVNFEDVEQGADHDMDAIALYEYTLNANGSVTVNVTSQYAAGCIIQHIGYVISGTTADGIYLEVRDADTANNGDVDYFLDTPPGEMPAAVGGNAMLAGAQPLAATRTFDAGASTGASLLKDPLWYAAKWGGFLEDKDTANDVPDQVSEWDGDGDGAPDNYYLVTNALTLKAQIAKSFNDIIARVASASSASVNSGSISSQTRVYQARFNSGNWSGELLSYPVNPDGSLGALEWNAAQMVPDFNSRTIITVNTSGSPLAVPFRYTNLDGTRRTQMGSTALAQQTMVNYLRGDGSKEVQSGGLLRNRPLIPFANKLGDIVDSAPVFVGAPPFRYTDTLESQPYSTFLNNYKNRKKLVYVGANDGMVHAFDAVTGQEALAFIPSAVFPNLPLLASPSYVHQYFVDGSPTMGDAFFGGAWHTMLVGGLNKGGRSVYALDITDPSGFSEASANSIFKWEYSDSNLGYTFSRPAIVRMHNNKWAAVFGNGYNNTVSGSATGRAYLYIVDIQTGALMTAAPIDTKKGSTTTPNGLATPAVVDIDGDSTVDYIYAGDLLGNMWKFDVTNATPSNWKIAFPVDGSGNPTPLFTAKDAAGNPQPITSRPEVGRGPNGGGMIVLFGTGKYLEPDDKDLAKLSSPYQKVETFYGIIDKNTSGFPATDQVTARSQLTQQTIQVEQSFTLGGQTWNLRLTSQNPVGANRGWYMDLVSPALGFQGEMQVSDSVLRNGRIVFTTLIPSADPCEFGGTSWLMEMDALSGARLQTTPFDLNNDGMFNSGDFVTVTIGGSTMTIPASGLQSQVGITPKPGILAGANAEYKYTPGTSGDIQMTVENPGAGAIGRQSWRQIR